MSIMDNATAPGLTLMGGFDVMQDAHDLVMERHAFPPHLCDATAFYADPSALFVADVVGAGAGSAVPRQFICAALRAWHGAGRRRPAQCALCGAIARDCTWCGCGRVGVFGGREKGEVDESDITECASSTRLEARGHASELGASHGWRVFEYGLNAWFHGSAGVRRRLYSVACSERAMQAASRAGVERPEELMPVPFRDRLVMRDVMLDDATIDGYHTYLYTSHVLSVPSLHGDVRDQRQVARVDTGFGGRRSRWAT